MEEDGEDVKPELNPVERFEKAFQSCLSVITKEDTLSNLDHDEIRVDTEFSIKELMEKARAVEAYFLKKRLHIAHLKPELILKDDTNELRLELMRKDELLKKNYDKISQWQNILADVQSVNTSSANVKGAGTTIGNPINPNQPPTSLPIVPPPQSSMNPGGPLTPGGGGGGGQTSRSQTPGAVSRPLTPMGSGPMTPGRSYPGMGQQQQQQSMGPLAALEKTASTIGMNP